MDDGAVSTGAGDELVNDEAAVAVDFDALFWLFPICSGDRPSIRLQLNGLVSRMHLSDAEIKGKTGDRSKLAAAPNLQPIATSASNDIYICERSSPLENIDFNYKVK